MYYTDVKELNAQLLVQKNQEKKEVSELMRERDEARLKVEQLERVLDRSDEHKFRLSHDFQPISPPPNPAEFWADLTRRFRILAREPDTKHPERVPPWYVWSYIQNADWPCWG